MDLFSWIPDVLENRVNYLAIAAGFLHIPAGMDSHLGLQLLHRHQRRKSSINHVRNADHTSAAAPVRRKSREHIWIHGWEREGQQGLAQGRQSFLQTRKGTEVTPFRESKPSRSNLAALGPPHPVRITVLGRRNALFLMRHYYIIIIINYNNIKYNYNIYYYIVMH